MNLENLLIVYKKAKSKMGAKAHDIKSVGKNISCGDEIEIFIKLDGDKIADISFQSAGCVISTSATYLLTEKLKGKMVDEVKSMSNEDFFSLIGLEGVSPARLKCVVMPFITLKRALK